MVHKCKVLGLLATPAFRANKKEILMPFRWVIYCSRQRHLSSVYMLHTEVYEGHSLIFENTLSEEHEVATIALRKEAARASS